MNYSLQDIIRIIGGKHIGCANNLRIDTLLTDSRSPFDAKSTLFFALTTKHGSGVKYIGELYDKGVRAFVVDSCADIDIDTMGEATFIIGEPLRALQLIAAHHRREYRNLQVVGITGSNGKTIVKEWLYQLVGDKQPTVRSPRSYNSQIGVPLSVILIKDDTRLALIEAGISQPDEMQRLESIIKPQFVVLTNIGSAHQENFDDLRQKAKEKLSLAKEAQKIIYPQDDHNIADAIREMGIDKSRLLGWSRTDTNAPLYIEDIHTGESVSTIRYIINGKEQGEYSIPFVDFASVQNSITCLAATFALGHDHYQIAEAMKRLEPVAMRLEVKEGQRGLTIINDSYNSDVNSLSIALDFMGRRRQKNDKNCILVLSDILQSGENKQQLYKKVAELVNNQQISHLIAVGTDIEPFLKEFSVATDHFRSTEELINSRLLDNLHDSLVLLKGARAFRFDKITALLEKRAHATILEVNLNAVVDNLNHFRALIKPETKIICMVKASAYGAGSIEVSKTLQNHKVDYLAVAVADEGVALRLAGITNHVMIMNPEEHAFHELFNYNLEPEVYSFKLLNALIKAADNEGITDFPVHIKLDTGMHRLGFDPEHDIEALIDTLRNQNAVKPVSIFSHLVGTDDKQFDNFTHLQFKLFDKASLRLQAAFPNHHIMRHICNSAGIERFPQYHLDMVRLGIGLYGINPYDNSIINNISTLKTTILQIRDVPATDTVGYSRRGVLHRPSRIAAIPIGYADGLNRHLGRGVGHCLVNGKEAPYVGNICMDVCMIDVTDIDCEEGDSVEVFGDNLSVTVLSNLLDTIPYEVLTSVSERVKRVYYND